MQPQNRSRPIYALAGQLMHREWNAPALKSALRPAVIADEEGFAVNHRKTRIMRAGRRQHVTGVIVNVYPNLPRDEFDRLKAILTNCIRHGPASQNRGNLPDFRAHLTGKVAHVAGVNTRRGEKLRRLLQRIAWS